MENIFEISFTTLNFIIFATSISNIVIMKNNWIQNHKFAWKCLSLIGITVVLGTVFLLLCDSITPTIVCIEYIGAALIAILFNLIFAYQEAFQTKKWLAVPVLILAVAIVGTMSAATSNFDRFWFNIANIAVGCCIAYFVVMRLGKKKEK